MSTSSPALDVRGLLGATEFAGVVATVAGNNPGMAQAIAERIVTDALAFVAAAARNPGEYIQPSRTVDEGWHALILHTDLYARLCDRLGAFIHHYPERPDSSRHDDGATALTLRLIQDMGHRPDPELWTAPDDARIPVAARCSHIPKPGGCSPIEPIPRPPKPSGVLPMAGRPQIP